jgi:hypothetical protein
MLLFIFSLYKTFYLNPTVIDNNVDIFTGLNEIATENIVEINDKEIVEKQNIQQNDIEDIKVAEEIVVNLNKSDEELIK